MPITSWTLQRRGAADRELSERGWVINVDVPRETPALRDDARQPPKLLSNALDSPHVFVVQGVIFDFNDKHRRPRQAPN